MARRFATAVVCFASFALPAAGHAPSIGLTKRYLTFIAAPGRPAPPAQTLQLTNTTHGPMSWTATASTRSGGNWLAVTPRNGSLPGLNAALEWNYLTVSIIATSMPAGAYAGTITISAPGGANSPPADNTPQTVDVALTIGESGAASPSIGVSSNVLSLEAAAGRSTALPLQITNLGGGSLNWSASASTAGGGNWLAVSPGAGVNAGMLNVMAAAGALSAGVYTGTITVSAPGAANSPQQVAVTFRVRAAAPPVLQASPAGLTFSVRQGEGNPPSQALQIGNGGEGLLSWRATASTYNGGPWLQTSAESGFTPGGLAVSVQAEGIAPGSYAGTLTIQAEGAANSPLHIAVTLSVLGSQPQQPTLEIRGVVDAATFLPGPLAPGQILTLFGSNLGPRVPVSFTVDPLTGRLPLEQGGVRVTFDGVPAPLFYASEGQVNLQVPFEVAGQEVARMVVRVAGFDPAELPRPVREAAPGVFTVDGTRAAALNPDSSPNSPDNPAPRGGVLQLFLSGQGLFDPPVETGRLAPAEPPFPSVRLPVAVTLGGLPAAVLYAGAAPGLAGVAQVNVEVPTELAPSSETELSLQVGSYRAGKRVTVSVR